MKHSVHVTVGILDPLRAQPRIARPVTVPGWFAGLLLLVVGVAYWIDQDVREVAYQVGWIGQDVAAWVDRVILEWGVWLGLPAPVMVWGVG